MAIPVPQDAKTTEQATVLEVFITSDANEARRVQEDIETALKARHYTEQEIFSIRLALEEALVNAIKHGNRMDKSKKIQISYLVGASHFEVLIADEGAGFDPACVPDPTADENIERPCGRGLMLMKHYMSEVAFSPRGNTVRMCKVPRVNGQP